MTNIEAGTYAVKATKEGYEDYEGEVVVSNDTTVEITLVSE